jgi:hypothetical protein
MSPTGRRNRPAGVSGDSDPTDEDNVSTDEERDNGGDDFVHEDGKSLSGKKLRKVTVAARAFPYRIEAEHQYEPGKLVYEDRTAYRGEEIELLPADHARGVRFNAFLKSGQSVEDLGSGGAVSTTALQFSAKDATDTELINWIKDGNPSVQDVVDASEGDPETAARLLSAEGAATGNDPRKGVVMGLEAVVSRAGSEQPSGDETSSE